MGDEAQTGGKVRTGDNVHRHDVVLALLNGALSEHEAAERCGVTPEAIRSWKAVFLAAGTRAVQAMDDPGGERAPTDRSAPRAAKPQLWRRPAWLVALLGVCAMIAIALFGWQHLQQRRSAVAQRCDDGVAQLLAGLEQPLTLRLMVTPLNQQVKDFAHSLDRLLGNWAERAQGKLDYQRIDIQTESDGAKAHEYGLQESNLTAANADGVVSLGGTGYLGLALEYGGERAVIPVLDPTAAGGLEFWIANKIREVVAKADDRSITIGLATSEGGVNPRAPELTAAQSGAANLVTIFSQNLPFYKFVDAPLSAEIDDAVRVLLLTQPGHALTGPERKVVDAFLMRGDRTLVVVASAVNLTAGDATLTARVDAMGIDALLLPYGIELESELVVDQAAALQLPTMNQAGDLTQFKPQGVLLLRHDAAATDAAQPLDASFAPFFQMPELAYPFASGLAAHPERQTGMRFRNVAQSSAQARGVRGPSLDLSPSAATLVGEAAGRRVLAIAAEGTLKSAFGTRSASARLLVLASSQFLANPLARAGNPIRSPDSLQVQDANAGDRTLQMLSGAYAQRHLTSTIVALKNVLDWSSADEDLLACSALPAPAKN